MGLKGEKGPLPCLDLSSVSIERRPHVTGAEEQAATAAAALPPVILLDFRTGRLVLLLLQEYKIRAARAF